MKTSLNSLVLSLTLLCLTAAGSAQLWSGILNPVNPSSKGVPQSAIDWSTAGVPGGIPSVHGTQCGSTIQASTYGNGTTDATAAVNSALAACGTNQYVLLS